MNQFELLFFIVHTMEGQGKYQRVLKTKPLEIVVQGHLNYRIVASTSSSHFKAHAGLFRLLMKGIFDPYEL